ncbi:MAG: GNAT family N-acetyltransferase [Thermomicrobiales bacterium]
MSNLTVRRIDSLDETQISELTDVLVGVVNAGASVGFLPPLDRNQASGYWNQVLGPSTVLLIAEDRGRIVGTGQLDLAMRANGRNRAEVCKVLVLPSEQGKGIGKSLMLALETEARRENRGLLHLDTNEGDKSNRLYTTVGYTAVGTIPDWATSGDGSLHGTTFYYKVLEK